MAEPRSTTAALRRYPALGFLLVAALLALLLPSGLTLPTSGPSSLAESAPVPGEGAGDGDLSELGDASSSALGVGSPRGGRSAPGAPGSAGSPTQRRASVKDCVGTPPRQTEDPLSPPCVAFFEGDNGGATSRGVSGEEIRLVVQLPSYSSSRPAEPFVIDYDDPEARDPDAVGDQIAAVIRTYGRYFTDRYQLYGRRLHFFGYRTPSNQPDQIAGQVRDMIDRLQPFAIIPLSITECAAYAKAAAEERVLSLCYAGFDRQLQRRLAPFLLSYSPDLQDGARIAASYYCRKLAGRRARYSGNATDTDRERKLGVLFKDTPENVEWARQKDLFVDELRSCGVDAVPQQAMRGGSNQAGDGALNVAGLRNDDVTTAAVFGGSSDVLFWTNAAAGQSWYPEWFVPGSFVDNGPDRNFVPRNFNQVEWNNAFGLSYDYRRGTPPEQHWHRAYNEGCGYCGNPEVSHPDITGLYDRLVLLAWGLQAAGPRLTPANVDKGLHAIPERSSTGPDAPAAYFSPGNYSWIKDAMAIRWDGAGEEPGSRRRGCYRLPNDGRRFRAGEWPEGDADIGRPDRRCQGPDR